MGERDGLWSRRGWLRGVAGAAAGVVLGRWAGGAEGDRGERRGGRVHRVMTCNVLLDLAEHRGTEMDWAGQRRAACVELIRSRRGDVVCLQEVGPGQNEDFIEAFGEMGVFGYPDAYVDRRPARFQGIKNVILYARERYELVSGGQYWLSGTPLVAGSKLEGVNLGRHVTWVRLRVRGEGRREFRVLNTHWSLKPETREQEAGMVAAEAGQYAEEFPQVLCGDFNSELGSAEQRPLAEAGWRDTYVEVHGEGAGAAATTGPATRGEGRGTLRGAAAIGRRKIDFVFCRGAVRAVGAEVFRNTEDGRPASDHPFVWADVEV